MFFCNVLCDCKPQPRAAFVTGTRGIGAIETCENMRKLLLRYTDAGIGDFNKWLAIFHGEGNLYIAFLWRVFYCIVNKDNEKLGNAVLHAENFYVRLNFLMKSDVFSQS